MTTVTKTNSIALCALAVLLFAQVAKVRAQAAIEAFANLDLSNFQLFQDVDADGMPDQPLVHGDQVFVGSFSSGSSVAPNITSIPGGGSFMGPQFEAPSFYEGAGASPAENIFTNITGSKPFAHCDTTGNGNLIAGLPIDAPISTRMVSEVDLRTDNFSDVGTALSTTSYHLQFNVIAPSNISVVAVFNASRILLAAQSPSPPATSAVAGSSFVMTINQGGAPFFQWSPDGMPGPIVGGVELADPFALNENLTAAPNAISGPLDQTGQFRAQFALLPGMSYTLDVQQSVSANAAATAVAASFPPGDFDKDTDVDLTDYLTLSTHLLTDVSGLTSDQSYLLGDMTKDSIIDGNDFCSFEFAFDDANGVGAFAAMQRSIPEPTGAWLVSFAGAAVVRRRRRLAC